MTLISLNNGGDSVFNAWEHVLWNLFVFLAAASRISVLRLENND